MKHGLGHLPGIPIAQKKDPALTGSFFNFAVYYFNVQFFVF